MRKLWISDIHGHYKKMVAVLKAANYDAKVDHLVVGGDMIDRGPESAKVLTAIRGLQLKNPERVTVIKGNHESMYHLWLIGKIDDRMYFQNGGYETIQSMEESFQSQLEYDRIVHWMLQLPFHHEDENYFYVHAGINPDLPMALQNADNFLWERDDFLQGDKQKILNLTGNRPVVHGHTPRPNVVHDGARINGDLGSYLPTGSLALVDLTNQVYYAYESETVDEVVTYDIIQRGG